MSMAQQMKEDHEVTGELQVLGLHATQELEG